MKEQLISAAEAAKILGVTVPSLSRWDDQGILCPVLRLGDWRIRAYDLADVQRLLREREQRAAAGLAGNGRGAARMLESVK